MALGYIPAMTHTLPFDAKGADRDRRNHDFDAAIQPFEMRRRSF